ncbi:MAG: helix-turn-helix transcriptional regulator [Desulfovibrio sp.]|uniref:helix-turn-helix transcriptional regulator n=1 Tax=Desulfovibrio sp. 7SRBS1 TaxID=3378064 RepID=UPI003B3CA124
MASDFSSSCGMEGRRLLTVEDLARYLGLSANAVRVRLHRGQIPLPVIKHNRRTWFDIRDVDAWVDSLPRVPAPDREA